MKIAIDCDDVGLTLKTILIDHLRAQGVEAVDLNLLGRQKVDYPDIGYHLAKRVAAGEFDRGILICGTGLGMAMVANKVPGVFAGTCHDTYSAERLKKSNDANVLTLGARVVGPELAKTIVTAWISSEFAGGGSTPKVERMREIEKQELAACTRTTCTL
jgi:ribose 5-phosphate isomerase B